jgi:hypothetical protein
MADSYPSNFEETTMAVWYTLFWILPAWKFHETVVGMAEGSSWFPWSCLYSHVSRGFSRCVYVDFHCKQE